MVCFIAQSGLHKRHSSSQPARLDRYGSGSSRTFCIKWRPRVGISFRCVSMSSYRPAAVTGTAQLDCSLASGTQHQWPPQAQIYTDKQMTEAVRGVVLQNNTEREAQWKCITITPRTSFLKWTHFGQFPSAEWHQPEHNDKNCIIDSWYSKYINLKLLTFIY